MDPLLLSVDAHFFLGAGFFCGGTFLDGVGFFVGVFFAVIADAGFLRVVFFCDGTGVAMTGVSSTSA